MSDHGMQRQRHGVAKNLAEGIGGLVVGAALVLLTRGLMKHRARSQSPSAPTASAAEASTETIPSETPS